ncbi:MAG: hypothetical protein JSU01_13490 [Bacteroidetes bacterium]|nr:hypothetical protein [Bacteroidota bacterium]
MLTLSFLLCIKAGLCQSSSSTKRQVTKLFKSSIGNGEWTICNQDNAFFKADTLRLYNNINYFYQLSSCCQFIQWKFFKEKSFVQSAVQICKEPASSTVVTPDDYYTVKYFSKGGVQYLFVLKEKSKAEIFQLIGLQEVQLANNNSTKIILLKRLISKSERPIVGSVH